MRLFGRTHWRSSVRSGRLSRSWCLRSLLKGLRRRRGISRAWPCGFRASTDGGRIKRRRKSIRSRVSKKCWNCMGNRSCLWVDIDLVAVAVIEGETFGSAVGLVDVADVEMVGQGEFFIVMSDGKSEITAEADRGAGFVVVNLSEFDGVDAVGISQFLLGNAVGDIDLERAGLCQR